MIGLRGEAILVGLGAVGGAIISAFGGCDAVMQALILFMALDYTTGFIVAAVFNKSKKSINGALESSSGFKGIIKKGMMLLIVLIGHQLDVLIGTEFVRYAVIIAFSINEIISILENAELMGVPIHKLSVLKKALGILGEKGDVEDATKKDIH